MWGHHTTPELVCAGCSPALEEREVEAAAPLRATELDSGCSLCRLVQGAVRTTWYRQVLALRTFGGLGSTTGARLPLLEPVCAEHDLKEDGPAVVGLHRPVRNEEDLAAAIRNRHEQVGRTLLFVAEIAHVVYGPKLSNFVGDLVPEQFRVLPVPIEDPHTQTFEWRPVVSNDPAVCQPLMRPQRVRRVDAVLGVFGSCGDRRYHFSPAPHPHGPWMIGAECFRHPCSGGFQSTGAVGTRGCEAIHDFR